MNRSVETITNESIINNVHFVPFNKYMQGRERTITHAIDLPFYLLLPEITQLLAVTLDDRHRLLFEFMFFTGARISEALSVRPKDLVLDGEMNSYVSLETLKRATKKSKGKPSEIRRLVPITDLSFILTLQRYIKTHGIKKLSPLFSLSRQASLDAIKKWAAIAGLPEQTNNHTLRHSFAVNLLLHGQQIYDIKNWLGHSSLKTTEVYLQVLGTDTAHKFARTQFRLPVNHLEK